MKLKDFVDKVVVTSSHGLIVRQFTNTDLELKFMEWQAGEMVSRPFVKPVYGQREQLLGHTEGTSLVSVFHLRGYGVTEADALAMAGVRA